MPEFVIGVDIGGTKSHLALFDTEGNFLELGHWGPLNHEVLPGSFDQFERELKKFLKQVLSKHKLKPEQIAYSALGVAGVDTRQQHKIVSEILSNIGLKKFTLANDAYLGIPAGSETGTGICAINGTGCTLAGINKKGDMLQIGGVGLISDDKGGGGYMGERIVSAVYSELFRKGEPTVLTKYLFEKLGITSKYDFVEAIQAKMEYGSFNIYKISPWLFKAVSENDTVAADILREIACSYANGISCMIEELKFSSDEELHIVLAGSVFVRGEHPLLVDSLKDKVSKDNAGYNIKYNLLNVSNVAGAVIWALNSYNGKPCYYEKVCEQLKN